MTVTVANIETFRDEVASLLNTALVGSGLPVAAVYNYEKKTFDGQSPVIEVVTNGDDFARHSQNERVRGNIYLDILSFVLYADETSGWTEAHCEDRLNLVKKGILETIFNNQFNSTRSLTIPGRSAIVPVTVGGVSYRMETIPLRVEVFNG